ncbi:hypothetical protein MtrunA17_Chr4g0042641 [Medicago truncatula]|uniref:Uncharacterized protein n=1 Tax=Medicago truncatula TaxID=3880 RepID=A0A396I8Q2_MEDTR|nr:hypothetical protein MtrunA17_Chr4g0042641 [Medicago truncatula]
MILWVSSNVWFSHVLIQDYRCSRIPLLFALVVWLESGTGKLFPKDEFLESCSKT